MSPYDWAWAADEFDRAEAFYENTQDDKCIEICQNLHDSNKTPPHWCMKALALWAWATDSGHVAELKWWYIDYLLLHEKILYDKRPSSQLKKDIEEIEDIQREHAESIRERHEDKEFDSDNEPDSDEGSADEDDDEDAMSWEDGCVSAEEEDEEEAVDHGREAEARVREHTDERTALATERKALSQRRADLEKLMAELDKEQADLDERCDANTVALATAVSDAFHFRA